MEKKSGGEDAGDEIAEINNLVEDVELAGVVEAGEDERRQAEEEEVGGVGGVRTAKINEKSDEEIDGADGILIIDGGIGDVFADDDVGAEGDAIAANGVEGGGPASDGLEEAGDLVCFADGEIVDLGEHVAGADALVGGGTAGRDLEGVDGAAAIDPRNSIIGKAKLALLLKIDEGAAHGGDGHDNQEGADKLALKSAQNAVFLMNRT